MVVSRLLTVALVIAAPLSNARDLGGSWCVGEEELVITFLAGDSVSVASTSEDGVNGKGTYEKQDTMFVATLSADDLTIVMGYQYAWKTDTTIEARTLFLTINGDSVNTPAEKVMMRRCAAPGSTDAGDDGADRKRRKRRDK